MDSLYIYKLVEIAVKKVLSLCSFVVPLCLQYDCLGPQVVGGGEGACKGKLWWIDEGGRGGGGVIEG